MSFLASYSCQIVGVSWMEIETAAKESGIPKRTFSRCVSRLESYGILEVISGRKNKAMFGKFRNNIYRILPMANLKALPVDPVANGVANGKMANGWGAETPTATKAQASKKGADTKSFNTKLSNEKVIKDNVEAAPVTLVIDSGIPFWFVSSVKRIAKVTDAMTINILWKSVTYVVRKTKTTEISTSQLERALYSLKNGIKVGKVSDEGRFFYTALYSEVTKDAAPSTTVELITAEPKQKQVAGHNAQRMFTKVYSPLLGKELLSDRLPAAELRREQGLIAPKGEKTTAMEDPELAALLNRGRSKVAR
ncbi:MAG TPA: hypothetical protein VEZ55_08250 [Chitinophagaceae bacterium]|nr:hypothetical protein [Chitinophagaceae bacterium]